MEISFADKVKRLPKDVWTSEEIIIRCIQDEDDLFKAVDPKMPIKLAAEVANTKAHRRYLFQKRNTG